MAEMTVVAKYSREDPARSWIKYKRWAVLAWATLDIVIGFYWVATNGHCSSTNCLIRLLTELPRKAWLSLYQGRKTDSPNLLAWKETSLMNLVVIERILPFPYRVWQTRMYNWQDLSAKSEYLIFEWMQISCRQLVYKDFISSFEALVSFAQRSSSFSIVLWQNAPRVCYHDNLLAFRLRTKPYMTNQSQLVRGKTGTNFSFFHLQTKNHIKLE